MNNYSHDFDSDSNDTNDSSVSGVPNIQHQQVNHYSLEEYLRLRDSLNSTKRKTPNLSEEESVSLFVFCFKYVLPLILFVSIVAPLAIMTMGIMGVPMLILLIVAGYLIYSLPKISRAMRRQEAISLAEMQKAEYESFLKHHQKVCKKSNLKR